MKSNSSRLGTALAMGAVLATLAIALMIFGARFGLWEPIVGFGLAQKYMNPIAYAVFGLSAAGLIHQMVTRNRKGAARALIATVIGTGLLTPAAYGILNPPKRLPPINDITTSTSNPPQFMVLNDTREGAKNSLVYGGDRVAAVQGKLYPEIAPILSPISASEAFEKSLRIARESGWEIVAEDLNEMRFEATALTSIYAFKDDVVVVVTAEDNGSRVDIRSVSRIGRSDRGVNAARIKAFIKAFGE